MLLGILDKIRTSHEADHSDNAGVVTAAEALVAKSEFPEVLELAFRALIHGTRAALFWHPQRPQEQATAAAESVAAAVRTAQFRSCPAFAVIAVEIAIQVFAHKDDLTQLQVCIDALQEMAPMLPAAERAVRSFHETLRNAAPEYGVARQGTMAPAISKLRAASQPDTPPSTASDSSNSAAAQVEPWRNFYIKPSSNFCFV